MCTSTTFYVEGMTCTGCASKVTSAVNKVAGVVDAEVDLESGTVTVAGQIDGEAVRSAIRETGYEVS